MSELKKTTVFLVVAGLLWAAALAVSWPRSSAPENFDDQGQLFFPEFKDPLSATALEIVEWDGPTRSALPFSVKFKDGAWVIPSHSDYPADARDRLARAAGGIIGMKKDTIRTNRVEDHVDLGVLDPLDPKTVSAEGVGKRITLRDKAGNALADFILGKEVPGRSGMRFVREPNRNRVYASAIQSEPSSRFADWIETNLLKLSESSIRKVTFDNHRVDPERGELILSKVFSIDRPNAGAPWKLEVDGKAESLPEGKELDSSKITQLGTALSDLKIVGVRVKPPAVQRALEPRDQSTQTPEIDRRTEFALAQRGFYLHKGELVSNLGKVSADTAEGIVYTLRFGEVTFAEGEALSAGTKEEDEEKPKDDAKKDETKKAGEGAAGSVESRFVFVTARFDPSLIKQPAEARELDLYDDPFERSPAEREAEAKSRKDRQEREKADYEKKLADGKTQAEELSKRFAPWYYVVPGDAYRKIILEREALVRDKSAAPPSNPLGGGIQGFPPQGGDEFPGMPHP
jgi:hypothetical protein